MFVSTVSTVSAAGLLSIPGAAPYVVTKHAAYAYAYAYAEWLFMTYADVGVCVHAVCPQGVRTQMLENSGPAGKALMQESVIEADEVAAALLAAVETEAVPGAAPPGGRCLVCRSRG